MADLGDLSNMMKEGSGASVPDVEWLHVDEQEYQQNDVLPKQNLDVVPDLKQLWDHGQSSALRLVPNQDPKTMGDLSQEHRKLRLVPEELILRTAKLAIMKYDDPARIREMLASRFDIESLKAARTALTALMGERGLLGRYYVDAQDFPSCAQGSKAVEFARTAAATAPFVKAKKACGNCTHHQATPDGHHHCGVFHKELKVEIPFTQEMAEEVESLQLAKGRQIQAASGTPKDRIRRAYLAPMSKDGGQYSGQMRYIPPQTVTPKEAATELIAAESLVKKNREAEASKVAALKARPILSFLRRELIKGRSQEEVIQSLRLSFDLQDLKATQSEWRPLISELGLYGVVYSTQESFDDCREGADLLAKHGSTIKAIVAGSKCSSCIFSQVGRCMMYGRKLVASPSDVYTPETVKAVIDEHKATGRLAWNADRLEWGATPEVALRAIHKAASGPKVAPGSSTRLAIETQFSGGTHEYKASTLSIRDIVAATQRYMNEGLYGEDLASILKSRFDPRDLFAARKELRGVLAEQGLQGIKYIDPTVYEDYGRGCKEAGRLHRSRLVPFVKMGSKCGSCVLRSPTGDCSVMAKPLVVEPPYVDKKAEQRAILASGRSTEVSYEALMNNGLTMMAEYELQNQGPQDLDLTRLAEKKPLGIEFGGQNIDL